jgi:thioesterase domain-containing protein
MVAYEMAQQLFAAGARVALLALVDAAHPSRFAPAPLRVQMARDAKLCVRRLAMRAWLATGRPASIVLGERIVNETLRRGAALYRPASYPGRITLIRSEIHYRTAEPEMGWTGVAALGVDLRRIPGNHAFLLTREHVGPAARELQICLREAQARESARQDRGQLARAA